MVKGIAEISVNVNYNPSQGRLAPKTVDFYASQDGVVYKRVGTSSAANDDSNMKVYTHHLILQKGIDAKYIKVVMNGITSNWVHIDSFRAYLYKETNSTMSNNDYYINEEMPTVTEDLYWNTSDSDYSKKINLASGLPQRIYLLSPMVESQKTDYYNTPASTTQLTDGNKGGSTYSSPNFVHFTCGMAREIVYDLGKLSAVESVTAGFLVEKATGVNLPNAMYV